jgi:Tol biopolymer transport system component
VYAPTFSPDGAKIAYVVGSGDHSHRVWVMNADGGDVRLLTATTGAASLAPAWSPTADVIAFHSNVDPGGFDIYTIAADSTPGASTDSRVRLTSNFVSDENPSWSPDGARIAFTRLTESTQEFQIFVGNADGSGTPTRLTSGSNNIEPAWSPDGSRIAFASDRDGFGEIFDVFVMNADGSGQVNVTDAGSGEEGRSPNWSPDGRRLVFEQAGRVAILDLDGTGVRQLPQLTEWDGDPAWSPDGRRLVFGGAHACLYCNWLHTVRPDGTGLRLIRKAGAYSPTWSTSGRIAFVNDDDQYLRAVPPADALYTVKPHGSRLRKLFGRYWGTGQEPDWAPDGSRIAFRALHRIFALRANGRELRRLTERYSTPGDSEPTWSPDGRYIAFIRDYDLYVMRSNGRGLRRLIDVPAQVPSDPTRQWTELSSPSWQPRR